MIKKLLLFLAITFAGLTPAAALAYDPLAGPCQKVTTSPICNQDKQQQTVAGNQNPIAGPEGVLQIVANVMAMISGIVGVIMMIYAGIRYITSSGKPEQTKKSKDMIINVIIGLVVIALAWSFISFVIQKFIE